MKRIDKEWTEKISISNFLTFSYRTQMPKIATHHLNVRSREQLNGFLIKNKKSIQCLKSFAVLTANSKSKLHIVVTNKKIKINQNILCMVKKKLKWKNWNKNFFEKKINKQFFLYFTKSEIFENIYLPG